MRSISFDPGSLTDPAQQQWWTDWLKAADDATKNAIAAWDAYVNPPPGTERPQTFEPAFQQSIWKDLKVWLNQHVFNERCAYCESTLKLDRYKGDAEHFRPKGRVMVAPAKGKVKQRAQVTLPDGTVVDHPGYFWLAYNWRNLVPACSFCNSGRGKVDQFPTAKPHLFSRQLAVNEQADADDRESPVGSRYFFLGPQALDAVEEPLLLNPLNATGSRAPSQHLRFGLGGSVVAVDGSPVGLASIKVYQLDRGDLVEQRHAAQEAIHRRYYMALQQPKGDPKARLAAELQTYRDGQEDYSRAALDYLTEVQRVQAAATAAFLQGLP